VLGSGLRTTCCSLCQRVNSLSEDGKLGGADAPRG
jgi:hypothetical protein